MARLTYKQLIDKHLDNLKSLRAPSGLFLASAKKTSTGYDKSWLRDNFYETIAFEVIGKKAEIRFYVSAPNRIIDLIEKTIYGY